MALGGDGDSYCDSEASLDDSCYDNLEDPVSPPPDLSLDLRHQEVNVSLSLFIYCLFLAVSNLSLSVSCFPSPSSFESFTLSLFVGGEFLSLYLSLSAFLSFSYFLSIILSLFHSFSTCRRRDFVYTHVQSLSL